MLRHAKWMLLRSSVIMCVFHLLHVDVCFFFITFCIFISNQNKIYHVHKLMRFQNCTSISFRRRNWMHDKSIIHLSAFILHSIVVSHCMMGISNYENKNKNYIALKYHHYFMNMLNYSNTILSILFRVCV